MSKRKSTDKTPASHEPTRFPDFRVLFESAPGLYLALTPQLKIIAVSDAYLKATMTKREEILDRHLFDVFPDNPEESNATGVRNLTASLERVVKGRMSDAMPVQQYDIRRPESEGGGFEERYWSPANFSVLNDDGELAYIIHRVEDVTEFVRLEMRGVEQMRLTDEEHLRAEKLHTEVTLREQEITHRKRAEEKLQQAEERMRSIVDNMVDGIITIDEQGTIESCNPAAETIFGYSATEVVGRNIKMLMPEPFHTEHDGYLVNYLRSGDAKIIGIGREVVGRRKDDSIFPMELSISAFQLGQSRHFTGLVRDVSTRKALELEIQQAQKMEIVGHLAGGVAHDFNNLLTVILGGCSFLESDEGLTADSRELAIDIHRAADRAAQLTRQLLAFSRKQILQPQVLDLNEVLANVGRMLSRLIGENITLEIHAAPDLWRVKLDLGQIEQVIVNLAVNSRDAMPQGGTLSVEASNVVLDFASAPHGMKPGSYVLLTVRDTGYGMDKATMSRIFEPFFTTKPVGQGTGLGLATVFGIVKQSDGHISVSSTPSQGTKFKLYFPEALERPGEGQTSKPSLSLHRGEETVLVVEDEDTVRKLACRTLRSNGYTVLEAQNGGEAIERFEKYEGKIHLLLSDVVMPVMGGRQLSENLLERYPDLKVLFASGYTDEMIIRHGVSEANTNFIHKPFMPADLLAKVRAVLDQR